MSKPVHIELPCPTCKAQAQVLWIPSDGDAVSWCENGHVVVNSQEYGTQTVFNFQDGTKEA